MGECGLRTSGYLAHETRVLQDSIRIFVPSQPGPIHILSILLTFAASHNSHTCKRLEEGQTPHLGFSCFLSFSGLQQFLPCTLAGTLWQLSFDSWILLNVQSRFCWTWIIRYCSESHGILMFRFNYLGCWK